jgi:23S rRNA pseudouridine1911/1915/1917 synthase
MVSDAGAPSVTMFERFDTGALDGLAVSLLRCRLVTGRRHQIRVHLAARRWPVLGDTVYGEPLAEFARLALHAWHIALDHPLTTERLAITCPPPVEFLGLMARCGLSVPGSGAA